jgi:hypothetical protein
MRSLHSRHAFAALDKLIDRHYIMSMTTETSMINSTRLIASLHAAEDGFDFAMAAKDWVAASRWRDIIADQRGDLELALRMEDPCTTMADVRFFEEFKYV